MLLKNARKKFSSDVPPSDRELWAIGMVVVRWSFIEAMVKAFVHAFTDENNADDPVRKKFDPTRSMQSRLDQWEELSRQHLQQEWLPPMLNLIRETRQVQDTRDKIVHGTWSDEGPFSWGQPGHPFSWNLNYGDIIEVALRIDRLQSEMLNFAFRASGVKHGEESTLRVALQRIQIAEP